MKKYKKPQIKSIELADELLDVGFGGILGSGEFAKRGTQLREDEYLDGDLSYSKNVIVRDEEEKW